MFSENFDLNGHLSSLQPIYSTNLGSAKQPDLSVILQTPAWKQLWNGPWIVPENGLEILSLQLESRARLLQLH